MRGLSLLPVAALACVATAADAAERHRLNLPGGRLGDALIALGRQAGISVGVADPALAQLTVPSLRGSFTVDEALRRLLRGTGAGYVAVDPATIRIIRLPSQAPARPRPPPRPSAPRPSAPFEPDLGQERRVETIVTVTGTRIERPDLTAPSPVTTIGNEQVALTGTTTVESLLNDLPQLIAGNNLTSNNAGGLPFSTLDLRGLGPARTLILVDRERIPPSSALGIVDVSQVPVGLIERIEVVTAGATAVYGSDAVAGVVNFILRRDFEGLELTGQVGIAEEGVALNYNIAGLFGGNFADGRGNATLYAAYFQRAGVLQGRFDYSRVSAPVFLDPARGNLAYVADDPSDIVPGSIVGAAGGSTTPPWGQVINNTANPFGGASAGGIRPSPLSVLLPGQFAAANTDCNAATPGVPVAGGGDLSFSDNRQLTPYFGSGVFCAIPIRALGSSRYNFAPDNFLTIPYDRFNLSVIGRYDFTDITRARLFASHVDTNSQIQLAAAPVGGGGFIIDPVQVRANCVGAQAACALPADLQTALDSRSFYQRTATGARFGTREACLGSGATPFACTLESGANEPFSFDRRFAEVGPRIGNTENQSFIGRAIVEHDFNPEWRGSAAFGWGRNDLVTRSIGNVNRVAIEQGLVGCRNAAGVVNGPGVLPGCVPVNVYGPNTLTPAMVRFVQTDTVDRAQFEQIRASVNAIGSPWELPGGPVGVALGAEVRTDRGEVVPDASKVRGEIIGFNAQQPQRGEITVREVYGEVRLPLLGGPEGFPHLLAVEGGARYSDYSTIGGIFNWRVGAEFAPVRWLRFRGAYNRAARAPSIFEIFQAGDQGFSSYVDPCNASNPARPTAFCALWASPAGAPGFTQNNTQVRAFAFGQPDLQEERGKTWTVGAVFTPDWWPVGRMSLTIDWYDITLRGSIQALSAQFYISQCAADQNLASDACQRISRNPATGQIERVNTGRRNSPDVGGPLTTSGIDVGFNWAVRLDEMFGGALGNGRVLVSDIFSWTAEYSIGGASFVDNAFTGLGGVISEWGNTLIVAYEEGPFTGQLRWVYKSGGSQLGSLFGPTIPVVRIPDLHTLGLSLRWRVSERFEFTGIVSNLLGELPAQTVTGTFEQSNTNVSFYSPLALGRSYAVQALVRF